MRTYPIVLAFLCAGCAAAVPSAPPSAAPRPSATAAAPSATPSATPTPTPTTPACRATPGRIEVAELIDETLPRSIPYRVYLPGCLDDPTAQPLPLLILLHGLQLSDSQWDELGVDETADRMIRTSDLPPLLIVMPWERKGLDFEAAVADTLLTYLRSVYPVAPDRGRTAIGGISRGAGWALRIGLRHPEAFSAIGLHSPAVLLPDLFLLPDWIQAAGANRPAVWIDAADGDTSKAGALELAAAFDELGIGYEWSTAPGEHSAAYWSARLEDYLSWYGSNWTGPAGKP